MRLHSLSIQGFGPFAGRVAVNFDEIGADGQFLISGPTGAGKTSLFDAICFALYGKVPGVRHGAKELRSHFASPEQISEVELNFSVSGRRFQIQRSPEYLRPKKRGNGSTKNAHRVALSEYKHGTLSPLSRTVQETESILREAIGLTDHQFTKLILLPQGDFSAFLLSPPADRAKILQRIFGTEHFAHIEYQLQKTATESRRSIGQVHERRRALLLTAQANSWEDRDLPDDPNLLGATEVTCFLGACVVAEHELADIAQHFAQQAVATLETAQAQRTEISQRLDGARLLARVTELELAWEEKAPQRAECEVHIAAAESARALTPALRAQQKTLAESGEAEERARVLERRLAQEFPTHWNSTSKELPLDAALAELKSLQEHYREIDGLTTTLTALDTSLQAGTEHVRTLSTAATERKAHVETLSASIAESSRRTDALEPSAGRTTELTRLITRFKDYSIAVGATAQVEEKLTLAQAQYEHARTAEKQVRTALNLATSAALASTLTPGQPCLVCGSCTHPQPAQAPLDQGVDEGALELKSEELERARVRREDSLTQAAQARGKVDALNQELRDLDEEEITAQLKQAQTDASLRRELKASIAQDTDELATCRKQLELAQERLNTCNEERIRTQEQHKHTEAALTAQRSALAQATTDNIEACAIPRPTTAQDVSTALVTARALSLLYAEYVETQNQATRAQQRLTDAQESFTTALNESPFTDEDELSHAMKLPLAELHEQQKSHQMEGLRLSELQAEKAVATARAAAEDATELETCLEVVTEQVNGLHLRVDAATERRRETALRLREAQAKLAQFLTEVTENESNLREWARDIELDSLCRGTSRHATSSMSLSTYALIALFDDVIEYASHQLLRMTTQRYRLVRGTDSESPDAAPDAGLAIQVFDTFTGLIRDPRTLSGGETFLTSLALALGLADSVKAHTGGIELECLFIDEGFGSLDADALQTVMEVLDNLRSSGRMIGVISHVSSMQNSITNQLVVRASALGSTLETKVASPHH